jgi:hypothetical protein
VHVLLDTCALLWLVGDPARLSTRARAALESTETEVYVSAISGFEIITDAVDAMIPPAVGSAGDKESFLTLARSGWQRVSSRSRPAPTTARSARRDARGGCGLCSVIYAVLAAPAM